ncbi:MAG TPA: hypothetical protein VN495_04320 [Candidatus Paceibacterota bacterium]|nr:hypothetical protein [Candidatus Paceibacterota bacterium]
MAASITPLHPGFPDGEPELMSVTVSYGPNSQSFEISLGSTLDSVLSNPYIREIIGFRDDGKGTVRVDGFSAERDWVLSPNANIEVIKPSGEKA